MYLKDDDTVRTTSYGIFATALKFCAAKSDFCLTDFNFLYVNSL